MATSQVDLSVTGRRRYFNVVGGSNEAARLQSRGPRGCLKPITGKSQSCTMVRRAVAAYRRAAEKLQYRHQKFSTDLQPSQCTTQVRRRPSFYHLLDLELSLGSQSRCDRIGQSLFHDDGSAAGGMAQL